jgi:hypothetical protein
MSLSRQYPLSVLLFIFACVYSTASQSFPPTITFPAIIRDQTFLVRDFEAINYCGSPTSNITDWMLHGERLDMIFVPPALRKPDQLCGWCTLTCSNVSVYNYGRLLFDTWYQLSGFHSLWLFCVGGMGAVLIRCLVIRLGLMWRTSLPWSSPLWIAN